MKTTEKIGSNTRLVSDGSLKYIEFDCFDIYSSRLKHCMSTRLGGVSEGECYSLNLGFSRNDSKENVMMNYKIICDSLGFEYESLVETSQVHDNKIYIVNGNEKDECLKKENVIKGIDGLVTNKKGITLTAFFADCVPVLLYDNIENVAALIHSGWRGTYKEISAEALQKMKENFGCNSDNITAAIGPSIHKCCFEVGEDVYCMFNGKFKNEIYYLKTDSNKWTIDLQGIIEDTLLKCDLKKKNIFQSNICTKCNKDLFFSYRGDSGRTGSLAAFMQLC